MLQTQVAYWANKETARHNLVTESQTEKDLKRKQAELDQTISYQRDQVQYWRDQLAELTRHNKVTESLTAEELETKRDQARAALQQAQASLKNAETNRRNLVNQQKQADAAKEQAAAATKRAETDRKESVTRQRSNLADSVNKETNTEMTRRKISTQPFTDVILPTVKALLPW